MFTIRNLRKEKVGNWTRLVVDFDVSDGEKPFGYQDTLWFAVENKNANMLTDDVYDAFAPFVLYLGMIYHQDVRIEGKVSPLLYHNLTHYVMTIFDNFSKSTKRVNLSVEGFKEAKKSKVQLIGTGFSCGVDSLNTIYSNYINAEDERFKIDSLFYFNCGQNGEYGKKKTKELWRKRIELHRKGQEELGLPAYYIDSNLHSFYVYTSKLPFGHAIYLGVCCSVLSVQKCVKRYYIANNLSYDEILEYGLSYRDDDLFEYSESYLAHLLSTECLSLVIDGCEFTRAEKIERIVDWDIAQKYLDVCMALPEDGRNCSKCTKCMRTLLVIDAMGKIDNFRDVFDLDVYHKMRQVGLSEHVASNNGQCKAVIKYLKKRNVFVPPKFYALPRFSYSIFTQKVKNKIKHIKKYGTWK